RDPVQPRPQGVLRAAGRRREAEDAGGRSVHAEARDDLLRGAEEPPALRPRMGLKKGPLTTRYLVRPARPHRPTMSRKNSAVLLLLFCARGRRSGSTPQSVERSHTP